MNPSPVTDEVRALFKRYGIDPVKHHDLVVDLMRFVYDQRKSASEEVIGMLHCAGAIHTADEMYVK